MVYKCKHCVWMGEKPIKYIEKIKPNSVECIAKSDGSLAVDFEVENFILICPECNKELV